MFKKIISVLLGIIIILGCVPMVYAASTASLYGVYGDSMLFAQNKEAILSGKATSGAEITAELYNSAGTLIRTGSSTASGSVFEVSFMAPAGGFEEYTIKLYVDGQNFDTLTNVVFGELWLASGQSNMSYPLKQEATGSDMYDASMSLSKWLRVLLVPSLPTYNGSNAYTPVDPQKDVSGASWVTGQESKVYNMSAVGYFFADTLIDEINMPVGILNAALGGSNISTWLSRDAIESTSSVANLYGAKGAYIPKASWNIAASRYTTMTANFNLLINPLRHFRPSGMIWYQGESDISNYTPVEYVSQITLLQKSYSEFFGHGNELMPIICTQLAPFLYSTTGFDLLHWNLGLVKFAQSNPKTRAVVTNYDLPPTYTPSLGFIHPLTKSDIGIRMGVCASGLVYNNDAPECVADVKSYKIEGSSIYINFDKNVGDGLYCPDDEINGFTICSGDGYYVPAKAKIVDKNTVRVYASSVSTPVSAAYAYCLNNSHANLYSTYNNQELMPVTPFILRLIDGAHYWRDKNWMYCDNAASFHNYDTSSDTIYYYAWESNTELYYTEEAAYSGDAGLHIATGRENVYIKPVLTYDDGDEEVPFKEIDIDYSDYGTFSFRIRNNLTTAITIESVDFYTKGLISDVYYSAMNTFTKKASIDIPGGSDTWYNITYDLNTLYRSGKTYSVYDNEKLEEVTAIQINFSTSGGMYINVDAFNIGAEDGDNSSTAKVTADNYPVDDGTLDPEDAIAPAKGKATIIDYDNNFIYGLSEALTSTTVKSHLDISDDATVSFSNSTIGTGTVITVKNSSTNAVVGKYTFIIFGDYNGDGIVDSEDTAYFSAISNFELFDHFDIPYLFMAIDVNSDGTVDALDEEIMISVSNFEAYLDQSVSDGSKAVYY